MKKSIIALVLMALLAGRCYAGQSVIELVEDTILTSTSTQVVSEATSIEGMDKVSFFVKADGTADTVSCEVTVEISYDGSNWVRAYFNDFAGGSTLQTSENDMEGDYYMWLDSDVITAPYVRISIGIKNPSQLATDETNTVSVQIIREN